MNPHIKGQIEKLLATLPKELHEEFEGEAEYMNGILSQVGSKDEAIDKLIYELSIARARLARSQRFMGSIGEILSENQTLFFHRDMGNAKDEKNGVTLQLISTEMTRLPAVKCKETGKTYMLNWEGICRLAVRCGVADDLVSIDEVEA